jgi:hypothetical protein
VLIPLTARALANEAALRWFRERGVLPEVATAILVEALLAFAWAQAALVLTRPYFIWHGVAPNPAVPMTLRTASWVLPLVALGAGALRGWAEQRYASRVPPRAPLPQRVRRSRIPVPLAIAGRVLLAVFLLAGLMDSFIDPIVVAVVMALLLALREPALRRLGPRTQVVMRVPVLPRLIGGAVVSALLAIVLVSVFGAGSVVRPVVISTLVSLIVFTLLLPDHVLVEHEHTTAGAHPTAPPPVAAGAQP